MVLIFSSNTNESRQVSREVERAVSQGVTIMPLRIEPAAPARSLAYFMAGVHWLDALTPPLEQHLQTLARSVTALLQAAPEEEDGGTVRERRFMAPAVRPRARRWVVIVLVLIVLVAAGMVGAAVRFGWLKPKPAAEAIAPPPAEPGPPPTAAKQEEFHTTIAYAAPTPPAPPLPAPSPTPPRSAPAPSPPPAPSAPAAATLYDGFWRGARDCAVWEGRPAFEGPVAMTIHNGKASAATKAAIDTPGYLSFQGTVDANGGLLLTGYGIAGGVGGLARGQRYAFQFQGTISGDVFSAKQFGTPRPCTITMNRQH